jgi:hypothetical protein
MSDSTTSYLRTLIPRLDTAPHGTTAPIIDEAAEWLQCSRQSVYRKLHALGWSSGRKLRADKNDTVYTKEDVHLLGNLLRQSRRQSDKQLLTVRTAVDILVADNKLPRAVSPSTANRLLMQHGVHPSQTQRATAHTQLRSLHPNHVWQIDSSVCVLYRMRNNGLAVIEAEEFRVNKPLNFAKIENERLLRYVAVDHFSGTFKCDYLLTPGESFRAFFEFLLWAFGQHDGIPMHGVPKILYLDKASGQMSQQLEGFWKNMGITMIPHAAGNARATGSVEVHQNIIEREFEGRLFMQRIESLEQLRGLSFATQINYNAIRRHSRHGHTRYAAWQMIRPEQLRIRPPIELCRQLVHTKPVTRKVTGDLEISFAPKGFGSMQYCVADVPHVRNGDSIEVVVNPYRTPNIYVLYTTAEGDVKHIDIAPVATVEGGFTEHAAVIGDQFKRHARNDFDVTREQLDTAAWGTTDKREIAKARKKGAVAFDGAINAFADVDATKTPSFMQRRGTEITIANPAAVVVRPLTVVEALIELRAQLERDLTMIEADHVRTNYATGVPADALPALVQLFTQGIPTQSQPMRTALRVVA